MSEGPDREEAGAVAVGPRDDPDRPPTRGERLATSGGELRDRHLLVYSWEAGFAHLFQRLDQLDGSWAERFARNETSRPSPVVSARRSRRSVESAAGVHPGPPASDGGGPVLPPEPRRPIGPALPPDVRSRLRAVAGPGADHLVVRTGADADALSRARRADAVTVGTEAYLRSGRFRPDSPAGFALLAHEARHVTAALDRDSAARRATPQGAGTEEDLARRVERRARSAAPTAGGAAHGPGDHPSVPGRPWRPGSLPDSGRPAALGSASPPPPVELPTSAPHPAGVPGSAVPMSADTDRAEDTPAAGASFDVEALRRSVIDDLMRRLRTDFERGA
ncbi:protein of unknown function [Modestobacter sp. DSM 44400]|uniref:eCIS core domain-containing protein n=1 Tax=Modestobacter sp. DSM 44400 TaxID=1550230 RepID=UPI000899A642|nr:DUF4157 domain-containing protein [Modestobacter sp. DSM 44400]SDY48320.1 protein of unknown function [Modestobacter sp. DSM 44400]